MTPEQTKIKLNVLIDEHNLVLETKVARILGISPIYLEQIKKKLNIHTIKVPRIVAGKRAFDFKKMQLKHAFEIVDYIEKSRV